MDIKWGAAIVLALILIFLATNESFTGILFPAFGTISVRSRADGELYNIQNDLPDPQGAADMLGKLHLITVSLMYHMKKNHPTNPLTIRLLQRYNPNKKRETHPINNDDSTSYTINKSSFSFCLRNKKTKQLHDLNTLSFTLLHEISHMAVDVVGHPPEFWGAFKTILQFAVEAELYIPIDYSLYPIEFCGLDVAYQPLLDSNLIIVPDA
jgi:hypothetical protein